MAPVKYMQRDVSPKGIVVTRERSPVQVSRSTSPVVLVREQSPPVTVVVRQPPMMVRSTYPVRPHHQQGSVIL